MATDADLAERIRAAFASGDPTVLGPLLAPNVVWGDCAGRTQVEEFLAATFAAGMTPTDGTIELGDDRLMATIILTLADDEFTTHHAVFVTEGLVVEVIDAPDAESARTVPRVGPFVVAGEPTAMVSVAPVLPVADVGEAVGHYQALGFTVRRYEGDAPYAFADRDGVALHLAQVDGLDARTTTSAVYLYVADARALYAEWQAAGVGGRLMAPQHTEYDLLEGAHIDPDGNLLRFGS